MGGSDFASNLVELTVSGVPLDDIICFHGDDDPSPDLNCCWTGEGLEGYDVILQYDSGDGWWAWPSTFSLVCDSVKSDFITGAWSITTNTMTCDGGTITVYNSVSERTRVMVFTPCSDCEDCPAA